MLGPICTSMMTALAEGWLSKSTGNVGIGTTGAGAKLEVASSDTAIGIIKSTVTNQQGWLRFDGNATTRGYIGWESSVGGDLIPGSIANAFSIRSQGALYLVADGGAATTGITIKSGNVGIGTTSPPPNFMLKEVV